MFAKVCERGIPRRESIVPRRIRNCILFGYIRHIPRADAIGQILEEVMVEDAGDAPKLLYVYIFLLENLVDVGACAA